MYEDEYKEDEAVEGEEENEDEENKAEEEQATEEQQQEEQNPLADAAAEAQQPAQPEQNPFVAEAVAETVAQQNAAQQQAQGQAEQPATNGQITPEQALANPQFMEFIKANDPEQYNQLMAMQQAQGQTDNSGTQALTTSYYNSINIDPNKTYGQTNSKPGYNYSYDAKQLQHDVNRAIFDYNKKIANGTIPGKTAADYIKPLKEDGMYGSKTKEAITALSQAGYNVTNLPTSVGDNSTPAPAQPSANTSSEETSTAPTTRPTNNDTRQYNEPIGPTMPALRTPSAPTGDSAYWDANRDATARDRQIAEINARGQSMDTYYGNLLEALQNQESYQNQNNNGTEWNQSGTGFGAGNFVGAPVYGEPRNGGVPSPYDNAPVVGNEDANLHDLIEESNRRAESGYVMETPSAPTGDSAYWNTREPERQQAEREPVNYNAMADELFQMDRNDWYQRPESQQAIREPEREPINYGALVDELNQLDRNDWYQRPTTEQPPERTPIEYSDAFIRQQDINDAYSPNQTYNDNYRAQLERMQGEEITSDDVQSSNTPLSSEERRNRIPETATGLNTSSEEQEMRNAYETAMQSADRARDIFAGLPRNEAEAIQQTREQWSQNQRNALESQLGPYMQQFRQDFAQLKEQFPSYSDAALMDMVLFNEEMRNGQSSYYKWLADSLYS